MKKLRILSILDDFTYNTLKPESDIELLSQKPFWYRLSQKIDFLLVESAWRGNNDVWRHKVAHYPNHPQRNNNALKKLVYWCKDHNIPTIFWNKEDPYHYDQFIESAKLFDYIFTTDAISVPRYQVDAPNSQVAVAPFFIQPQMHFSTSEAPLKRSVFMGTYQSNMHDQRTQWQDQTFLAAAPYGLDLFNRHATPSMEYKFPYYDGDVNYYPPVPYPETPATYRRYQQVLNVNTITDSPTMFSRRLIEVMACGRLVISNPSQAIDHLFQDMCIQVDDFEAAQALFSQLQSGYTAQQQQMVAYAHTHVQQHYTAKTWLKSILQTCNVDHPYLAT